MKIKYNVTGEKRKALVGAISQELNAQVKYLGAPTFAYEVGGYHIDKTGEVTGEDNYDLVAELQGLHDFKSISEDYDTPLPQADPASDNLQIPYEAALGGRVSPYRDYEEPPMYGIPEQDETKELDRLIIEIPRQTLTDAALEKLKQLVESKANLIKKAIGMDTIPLIVNEETIKFPWFSAEATGDEVNAYSHFVSALCRVAREHSRVTAKEKAVENEKFAFRVFLIRLGFVGDEYKVARKIMLRNLIGNSAFKNGKPKAEVSIDE